MRAKNESIRYGLPLIALHWLMLLLIVLVYACIELRELYPRGSEIRNALKTWHYLLGLSVFTLVWVRLAVRLASPTPPIIPAPPRWQVRVAHFSEFAIYGFMIAMPLLGWLILSAENEAVSFFGLQLPALVEKNKQLAEQIEEIHELVGNIGYFLIGIHAAAALLHHYVQRDNALTRMLPAGLKNR
jgi:superoxide oxidase